MKKSLFFAFASGLLFWASFAPFELWISSFLAAGLLFTALIDRNFKDRFLIMTIAGSSFFLPLLLWSGTYVGKIPWIALSALQIALFSIISVISISRDVNSALRFASAFSLVEILRMKFPFGGFGWGRIGFTQIDVLSLFYPFIGIVGITFLVLFLGALLTLFPIRTFAFLALLLMSISHISFSLPRTQSIRIDAVQGGVDRLGLDFNSRALSVLSRHATETEKITNPGDLIIWPENASDLDPIVDSRAKSIVTQTISQLKRPLLLGAVEEARDGPLNTSLLFDKNGRLQSRYIKQDLTPFGEYMPLRPLAESISPAASAVTNFQPGKQWVLHQIAGMRFASIICFELLDDDHIRNGLRNSDFAVAQTNNATFGHSAQASQQLQITRARAAEFGREIAAVSTTGWTAQIDSRGFIVGRLPQFHSGHLAMRVSGRVGDTPASKITTGAWAIFLLPLSVYRRGRYNR